MKIRSKRSLILLAAGIMISGAMVAYAATLFTQTFPGQTFATASLTAGPCTNNQLVIVPSESVIPGIAGSGASIVYACGTAGTGADAAFQTATGNNPVSVTPTFTVPSGWALGVSPVSSGPCQTGLISLTTATPVSLAGGTFYDYCLSSLSASTFTSFSITWSQ